MPGSEHRLRTRSLALTLLASLGGCTTPTYRRPEVDAASAGPSGTGGRDAAAVDVPVTSPATGGTSATGGASGAQGGLEVGSNAGGAAAGTGGATGGATTGASDAGQGERPPTQSADGSASASDGPVDRASDAPASRAIISIDFVGASTLLAPAEEAGLVPAAQWNEAGASLDSADGSSGTLHGLVTSDGTVTDAALTWTGTDSAVSATIGATSADLRMMRTYVRSCYAVSQRPDAGTGALVVSLSALPAPFATRGFDVIVYTFQEVPKDDPRSWSVSVGNGPATTVAASSTDAPFAGTFTPVTSSSGNYVRANGLSGSSVTIKATPLTGTRYDCAAISGLQLVSR